MHHQHLTIALRAGANADHRHLNGLDQFGADIARYALQQQDIGTGMLQLSGILNQPLGIGLLPALNPVAAEGIDRLRRQAKVGADRHAVAFQHGDGLRQPAGAFELDQIGAGLHQRMGGSECPLKCGATHEGHVGHDQAALIATGHGGGVIGELLGGHRQGAVVALQHHAKGVADQHHIDSGLADQP